MNEIPKTSPPDISDHDRWNLQLTVGDCGVCANFCDTATRRIFTSLNRSWCCDPADVLRKIEDAVYEDPALLDDYRTSILVRPTRMIFMPASEFDPDDHEHAEELISLVDKTENKDIWVEPFGDKLTAIFSTPGGVKDFLHRSFLTEDVHMALLPMYNHLQRSSAGAGERVWVHLGACTLDIIATCGSRLLLANTRTYNGAADAAFYIVMAIEALGMSKERAEVMLTGTADLRREIMPMLRRHLGFASNAVLPKHIKTAIDQGVSLTEALKNFES